MWLILKKDTEKQNCQSEKSFEKQHSYRGEAGQHLRYIIKEQCKLADRKKFTKSKKLKINLK